MRLLIFPANPYKQNGYSACVKITLERLKPSKDDIIIWYEDTTETFFDNDRVIKRPSKYAVSRMINVLRNRVNCEMSFHSLEDININEIDEVFCGEVIFYNALREIFPNKHLTVQFHNCFSRISDRLNLIGVRTNLKYSIQLRAFYKLERKIFNDKNTYKIFVTDEDRNYYTSMFGRYSDSEVWGFIPIVDAKHKRDESKKKCIVHYGGLQSHKLDSINWFINDVFNVLHQEKPQIEFHMWGAGTDVFNNPSNGIYGHGYYDGEGLPSLSEGFFINPDLTGGGIKMKLLDLFKEGATFISTPFGYEGYSSDLVDNKYCYVIEPDKWLPFFREYFK